MAIEPHCWTIYREPADHPHGYIARRWLYGRGPDPVPTEDTISDENLDTLRGKVVEAMRKAGVIPTCFHRANTDDPTIVEVWL